MDEKRKGEIALAIVRMTMLKETSLKDIANTKRYIGNVLKEKEMIAIKATAQELLDFSKIMLKEIFESEMKAIS
jgi:hypothetical protein